MSAFDFRDRKMLDAAKRHAIESYPAESVGAITSAGYEPLLNIHADPNHFFTTEGAVEEMMMRGELVALIHSHPDGPLGPSEADMAQQIAMGIPWGITVATSETAADPWFWGPGIPVPALEGRSFRHGPSGTDGKGDCFALIRDWFLTVRGIAVPDLPRDDEWWRKGASHYRNHYRAWGCVPVNGDAPQIGDIWFMQILSPVPNHGAIYVGAGQLLHHLPNRLSRVEPAINWRKQVCEQVRYVG